MIRAAFIAPLFLTACMHTPCPVPLSCVTPEDCVCLVTGAVDERRGGDGGQRVTPDKPDDNGGNGGGSQSSDGNGSSSDGNGGHS
ncbi:MAG: hypothetical protein EAY76_07505 [Alphaproteobacteria bacterium]|nr:MAG: hypothetical protein EAY76_07505 [Alphaproteobacteria bacterium]